MPEKNWQNILKSVSYPTTAIVLDFETYFDKDYIFGNLSTIEYVCDSRFAFTGLGIFEMHQAYADPENCMFVEPKNIESVLNRLQRDYGSNLQDCTIVGQNLKFDCLILKEKFGICPPHTVDVLDLARHEDSRRKNALKNLCKYYNVGIQKGDTKQFKGLHWEDATPTQQNNWADYCRTDVIAETELFRLLLPRLSNPLAEIALQNHTLQMYLCPRLDFNFELADDLINKMNDELYQALNKVDRWLEHYQDKKHPDLMTTIRSNKFTKALRDVLPENEEIGMKQGKRGNIPALAKTDSYFQYLLQHPIEKVKNLAQARLAAKSWPNHILRLQSIINQTKLRNNKLTIPLRYYGGHTGRWSGTGGTNFQNLPGRGRAGEGTHPLLQQIRNCIIAPPNYILGIVDLAQIEARVLAWFAGQYDLLEGFKNGEDVYSIFATTLFRAPVRKPRKSDPLEIQQILKIKRGFGKDAILGCGFGMGSNKFYQRCLANSNLKPAFDSGDFDYTFIDKLIKTYRKTYSKIPKFWNNVEKAFRWVTKYPHEHIHLTFYDELKDEAALLFYNDGGIVNIVLPSGRHLKYPHAKVNNKNIISWRHSKSEWGGSLTENIVQSTARDIFAGGILAVEKADFPIVLHSHDEIVCLFSKQFANRDLQKVIKIMCHNFSWCKDLPLEAEGELSEYYKK